MGLFDKVFGGKKEAQFQRRVLHILDGSGSVAVEPGNSPLSVVLNGILLDLTELYQRCTANEVQSEEIIRQHFSFPLAFAHTRSYKWNEAQLLLRPQIVPAALAEQFSLVLFPFAGPLSVSIVVNDANEQTYVRSSALNDWNVRPEELYNTSILNLNREPFEKEVTITDGTDRFIGLETHDGFDAARVLIPSLRDFAVEKLGTRYFAGLPNRDFLILWSIDCSQRFQDYAEEKIATDYALQPFPLSAARFEITNDAIMIVGKEK